MFSAMYVSKESVLQCSRMCDWTFQISAHREAESLLKAKLVLESDFHLHIFQRWWKSGHALTFTAVLSTYQLDHIILRKQAYTVQEVSSDQRWWCCSLCSAICGVILYLLFGFHSNHHPTTRFILPPAHHTLWWQQPPTQFNMLIKCVAALRNQINTIRSQAYGQRVCVFVSQPSMCLNVSKSIVRCYRFLCCHRFHSWCWCKACNIMLWQDIQWWFQVLDIHVGAVQFLNSIFRNVSHWITTVLFTVKGIRCPWKISTYFQRCFSRTTFKEKSTLSLSLLTCWAVRGLRDHSNT